jgi:thymidylate kinase
MRSIAIEGVDAVGKSTLIGLIGENVRNCHVIKTPPQEFFPQVRDFVNADPKNTPASIGIL